MTNHTVVWRAVCGVQRAEYKPKSSCQHPHTASRKPHTGKIVNFNPNINRAIMGNFQNLRVWQSAKDTAVRIYHLTRGNDFSKDYGLKDQIQRSAVSISSNIAEGDELGTDKLAIRYFHIAKGSCAELVTQLIISYEIGYIDEKTRDSLLDECNKISSMLSKLIRARKRCAV